MNFWITGRGKSGENYPKKLSAKLDTKKEIATKFALSWNSPTQEV